MFSKMFSKTVIDKNNFSVRCSFMLLYDVSVRFVLEIEVFLHRISSLPIMPIKRHGKAILRLGTGNWRSKYRNLSVR